MSPSASTHQQPQIYRIWRKTTPASPSSYLDLPPPRDVAVRYASMCDVFSYLSWAWRQCLEAIILSIGKHKRVFVMAICLTPRVKAGNSEDWKKKMLLVSSAVMLISIWGLTSYLEAEQQFFLEWRVSKPIKCLSRQRRHSLKRPLTQWELQQQANKQNKRAKKKERERGHVYTMNEHQEFSNRCVMNRIVRRAAPSLMSSLLQRTERKKKCTTIMPLCFVITVWNVW